MEPSLEGAVLRRGDLSLSGGDYLLSEEGLGRHTPAVRAFKLMDRKVGASWMLLYNSEPYRLATSRAGIIHKKVKRHGGILCKLRGESGHRTAELFAGSMKTSDHPAAIASDVFSSFLCCAEIARFVLSEQECPTGRPWSRHCRRVPFAALMARYSTA